VEFSLDINHSKRRFESPVVMGILNVAPDSFYDGGKYLEERDMLRHVAKMIDEGATFIDIGAASTRPGSEEIDQDEELKRLINAVELVLREFPDCIISADTYRSQIARAAIEHGAHIINDISGGTFDKGMFKVIAEQKVPYILMHIQGKPKMMQKDPHYEDVVRDIQHFFSSQLSELELHGINKNIILDPGFGFGKTVEHNYELLYHLQTFKTFGHPIMAGLSRKSMINKVLRTAPQNALNGTTVLNTLALLNGANILRVHDVKEAVEAIKLVSLYFQTNHQNR
jgi:dihydropteroate synthase